ncbi:unnamed protein product, partial [marine sediment metagenome]
MNLKFQDISWDEKKLMYVEFAYERKLIRWYPKWRDVAELLSSTFATEGSFHDGHLSPYLNFICLETLTREILISLSADMLHSFSFELVTFVLEWH